MDRQTLFFFIIIALIAIGGYIYFQSSSTELPPAGSEKTAEFEPQLGELRVLTNIVIDTAVLENSFFKSLSLPVTSSTSSIAAGRSNPFLAY